MHKAVFVLGLAACSGNERSIDVTAMRGDEPEPGAIVIAHHANGERIADVHVDASGHATVRVDDGDLVTLVYPHDAGGTRLFTVAPTEDIVVRGPVPGSALSSLGTFVVAQPANVDADHYYVQLACRWLWVTTWPQSFDIDSGCVGRDGNVPVVVTAYKDGHEGPVGYAAGLAAFANGAGTFTPTTWLPNTPNVPIVAAGLSPHVEWTLTIDGLTFGPGEDITSGGLLPAGLPVDSAKVRAWIDGPDGVYQTVERQVSGAPSQIALAGDDFLPLIPATLVATGLPTQKALAKTDQTAPIDFTWARSDVGADVVALSLGWLSRGGEDVLWTVVLPPDARGFSTLPFEGELDSIVSLVPGGDPSLVLAYLDSPDLVGYDDVLSAGIASPQLFEGPTVVPPPATGELRSVSTGYAP